MNPSICAHGTDSLKETGPKAFSETFESIVAEMVTVGDCAIPDEMPPSKSLAVSARNLGASESVNISCWRREMPPNSLCACVVMRHLRSPKICGAGKS
jgi:hypothetical protein